MAKRTTRVTVKRRPALRGAHLKGVVSHLRNLERFGKLRKRKRSRKR